MSKLAFIAISLWGAFFPVFSQTNRIGGEKKYDSEKECRISDVLNLTARQKAELGKFKSSYYSQDSAYFAKLEILRVNLIRESAKPNPNLEELNKTYAEIGQYSAELAKHFSARIREMRVILTDEQFEKFIEYGKNKKFGNFNPKERQK